MGYGRFVEFCNLSYNSLNDDAIEFFYWLFAKYMYI